MPAVVLCGPRPALPAILEELGVKGPIALVTAGWQEREDDQLQVADLGVQVVALALHQRAEEVFARDAELAAAYKVRQIKLRSMQDAYRVRLDHAVQAARTIALRKLPPELRADEAAASLDVLRAIDREHVDRCSVVNAAFDAAIQPGERHIVARHVDELRAMIDATGVLVIAGGHVAVLVNRLRLFDVLGLAGDRPIIAWSAGAMALTERIVLFHDDRPWGQAISEVLDVGFGLAPGVVALPDARARLRLDDAERVAQLAQRYTPATCVGLVPGAQLWIDGDRAVRGSREVPALRLGADGTVTEWKP